jgi:hypothetical protein
MQKPSSDGALGAPEAARLSQAGWAIPLILVMTLACALWFFAGPWIAPFAYERFWSTEGPHEILQFLVLLGCVVAAARLVLAPGVKSDRRWRAWAWLLLIGAVYAAGEEVSWGQHLIGWGTPELWSEVNDQAETNLHNTSALLDQAPRLAATLLVVLVGIILPIAAWFSPRLRNSFVGKALCSPLAAAPAVLVLLARPLSELIPPLSEHSYNPGEAKELFIYVFLLAYLLDSGARAYAQQNAWSKP